MPACRPRRELRSGKVMFEVHWLPDDRDPQAPEDLRMRATAIFDGQALRFDATREPRGQVGEGEPAKKRGKWTTQDVLTPNLRISRTIPEFRESPLSVRMEEGSAIDRTHLFYFHPNVMGLCARSTFVLYMSKLDDLMLTLRDCTEASAAEDLLDGTACRRVEQKFKSGAKATTWISKEPAAVLRYRVEFGDPARALADTIECRGRAQPANVPWFPETIEFTRTSGGRSVWRERTRIVHAEFGQAIDPATFTIAGLGLPAGSHVITYPASWGYVWDGTRLVNIGSGAVDEEPAPVAAQDGQRFWLIVGINLAVASLIGLLVYLRMRYRAGGA